MRSVCFAIDDVVEHVHGAGQKAEHNERRQGGTLRRRIERLTRKKQRSEDKEVLHPLPRAQQPQPRTQADRRLLGAKRLCCRAFALVDAHVVMQSIQVESVRCVRKILALWRWAPLQALTTSP